MPFGETQMADDRYGEQATHDNRHEGDASHLDTSKNPMRIAI
jgi:hypothetical protein